MSVRQCVFKWNGVDAMPDMQNLPLEVTTALAKKLMESLLQTFVWIQISAPLPVSHLTQTSH